MSEEDSVRESKNTSSRAQEKMKWWKVYALHFLFMWNTRTYEYASVSTRNLLLELNTDTSR